MSAHINIRRFKHPWIAASAGFILFACAVLLLGGPNHIRTFTPKPWSSKVQPEGTSIEGLQALFRLLHTPTIKADAARYKTYGGQEWTINGSLHWERPMGRRLCIIDLDNRQRDGRGEVFHDGPLNWDAADGLSLGILNHFMYASIHGYAYYYIHTETPPDRRASWKKPPIIAKILQKHEVCLYVDSDAIFNRLDLPFEFLLNYWQILPRKTALAMATDPNSDNNKDSFGNVYLNTGFIIAQNIKRTYEILDAWRGCPDAGPGTKYENCSQYRTAEPGLGTDQAAMGNFVRYDYQDKEDIRELSCTEANGYPQSYSGCDGEFIRHVWTGKDTFLGGLIGESMAGALLRGSHQGFLTAKPMFYMEEKQLMG